MQIKSKLTEKDFINANFVLLYSKTSMKIFTGIASFAIVVAVVAVFLSSKTTFAQISAPLIMLLLIPMFTYFAAKKNYAADQRVSETIEYQFEKDLLIIKSESFNAQFTWDKIYKVTQTKNWLMIWQSKQIANAIPKRDVWQGDIAELKDILETHRVKNNLQ